MLDIVFVATCIALVVAAIASLEYKSRTNDWLEQIYDRQGKLLIQNVNIQKQLEQIKHADELDGLEVINMYHPRTEIKHDKAD